MKKIISLLLAAMMLATMFVGCTGNEGTETGTPSQDVMETTAEPTEEPTKEPTVEPTIALTEEPTKEADKVKIEIPSTYLGVADISKKDNDTEVTFAGEVCGVMKMYGNDDSEVINYIIVRDAKQSDATCIVFLDADSMSEDIQNGDILIVEGTAEFEEQVSWASIMPKEIQELYENMYAVTQYHQADFYVDLGVIDFVK